MPYLRGIVRSSLLFGCAALLANCEERAATRNAPRPITPKIGAPSGLGVRASAPAPPAPTARQADAFNVSEIPEEREPEAKGGAPGDKVPSRLVINEAQVIAPAGQMTATPEGVVMINRRDELLLARRLGARSSARPEKANFSRVKGTANDFFAVARGPLVLRGHAYWIKEGQLVRRALDNSTPLEVLSRDARNGTRVVGADLPGAPAHALYISNPIADEAPRAKLWVERAGTIHLSPEGAGASSVAVAITGREAFVVAIDARSAMTPMHGRSLRFKGGQAELDADVVMWVGSTSQTLSEVFASATPLGVRAFLPIERDTRHFGLVMLELGSAPQMDPKATFRAYPNGIDVAPVASGAFCGSAFVAYVRPETPSPDSREVLEIAEISEAGLGPAELIDTARGFANLSLAAATNSAVLAYVADFRTFATTLRCAHQK